MNITLDCILCSTELPEIGMEVIAIDENNKPWICYHNGTSWFILLPQMGGGNEILTPMVCWSPIPNMAVNIIR